MTDTINEALECADRADAAARLRGEETTHGSRVLRRLVADLEAARAELARMTEERDEWKRAAMMHTASKVQAWAEREKAEAELAAAREAMPTGDERQGVQTCVVLTESRGERGVLSGYVREWLARLDAYHAAHPAASVSVPAVPTVTVELESDDADTLRAFLVDQDSDPDVARPAWATRVIRVLAASEARPAASPAAQTPEQPANGGGVDLEHGVPPSRGDIGGPSGLGDEWDAPGFDAAITAAFGSAPDMPEPCAVCSEALCECGTGRAGGGGHE